MDVQTLVAFLAATLVLLLTPGPVMAMVVGNTLGGGRTAGLLTVLGVGLGKVLLIVVSLVCLLSSSRVLPSLFPWVSLAGAAYLAWLSLNMLLSREPISPGGTGIGSTRPVIDGLAVASSNPAALLFYAAFFPSFIGQDSPSAAQMLVLGMLHVMAAVLFNASCVLFLGRIRSLASLPWLGRLTRLASAGVYFVTSVAAVVTFSETLL